MKPATYLLVSASLLLLTSCEVDVPDTDTTPPIFSFRITGEGFEHTFTQDDDFSSFQLVVTNNGRYDFIFLGIDGGGLQNLIWNWYGNPNYYLDLYLPYKELPKGWDETSRYDDFDDPMINSNIDGLRYIGDSTDVYSAVAIKGTFHIGQVYQEDYSTDIDFTVRDYGGLSGEVNTVVKRLHIVIPYADGPTELVPLNP